MSILSVLQDPSKINSHQSISHYNIHLTLYPHKHSFRCSTSVILKVDKAKSSFVFCLGKYCQVESISYLGLALPFTIHSSSRGLNLIRFKLPRHADAGEKLKLNFEYTGIARPGSGPAVVSEAHTELPPCSHWYPFDPGQQAYSSSITIVNSKPLKVIATGTLEEEKSLDTRYQAQWKNNLACQGLHVVTGNYIRTDRENLNVYYPRNLMNQAQAIGNNGQEIIGWLNEHLGPHPVSESSIILTNTDEANSHASCSINTLSTGLIAGLSEGTSREQRSKNLYQLTARELTHRWLKAGLVCEFPDYKWYLHALAEYISWVLLEEKFGISAREQVMLTAQKVAIGAGSISSSASKYPELPAWLPAKGSWIMRIMHCLCGESFFPAIRELLADGAGIAQHPKVFFTELGTKTGNNFAGIYREWVGLGNSLKATVESPRSFLDEQGQWQLVFTFTNQGKLNWPSPIDIRLQLDRGTILNHSFNFSKEPYVITTESKVVSIQVDPELKVLNQADKTLYIL